VAFQKILVPYDGSSFSNRAFKMALDLAQKYDSKVIIISCIDVFSSGWFGKSEFEQTLLKKLRGKIMKEIQDLENIAKKKNVTTIGKIYETASITKSLLNYAKSNKIDLIVIGSRGQSGLRDLFLGSISHGVIQRAKCPVLIVK
jgi:nucleotide-binding universal stress UspA family protein